MNKTKDNKSYQQLKQELDEILVKLQHPDTDIDDAVALHVKGQEVLNSLDAYLQKIADESEINIKKIG